MPEGETNRALVNAFNVASRGKSNSSKLSAARMPVQCTGSPIVECSSHSRTPAPRHARRSAATKPPGPPPTIRTSTEASTPSSDMCVVNYIKAGLCELHFSPARLPLAATGNPERQNNELHVETEARAFEIEKVEP